MGRGTDPRQIDFRPEFPGAALDREDGEEWGTGGGDGGGGGGGDVFQAGRGPPRIWACGHCTQEHILQWKEQGESSCGTPQSGHGVCFRSILT